MTSTPYLNSAFVLNPTVAWPRKAKKKKKKKNLKLQ